MNYDKEDNIDQIEYDSSLNVSGAGFILNDDDEDSLSLFNGSVNQISKRPSKKNNAEYVNMALPTGEVVRFKREWAGYRFTDLEVNKLVAGIEVKIRTHFADGIIGSLDFNEYNGYHYFGFVPWDHVAYSRDNAPVPLKWNGHTFTDDEMYLLRLGKRVIVICESKKTGNEYAVSVTLEYREGMPRADKVGDNGEKWVIVPHFDDFSKSPYDFTHETCTFMPKFGGRRLNAREISHLRTGKPLPFEAVSQKTGEPYRCQLWLGLDQQTNRWMIKPDFHI